MPSSWRTSDGASSAAAGSIRPTDRFSAYYHTLRWNRVTASRTDLLQAPFRAGIKIDHYQLEPLRMALGMPRVNLFVADGVGLGKTIEARLVARELLLRRKVSEIVVCCPPSMVLQWREEMEERFGLVFQIIDRAYVHRIRKERGFNVNPWSTHSRFIISHNLIKDEEYAADLRTWLGRDLVRARSLLILDEAHHAAPASGGVYAITSHFTRCITEFAAKFEHKIFLSATPHNGHSNSFRALMAILDPQRFCRGVPVAARERDQVLIYRLKEDLREIGSGVGLPAREMLPIAISDPVRGTPELELALKLESYCSLRENRLDAAGRARSQPDEKLKKLLEYIDQHMLTDGEGGRSARQGWTRHRIIVFTEYDDTLAYLRRHLEAHLDGTDGAEARVAIYRGSTTLDERQEIKEAFNTDPADHPVRILLTTDAAREGLNLQMFCSNLFHHDIPWNPARLEQRNGRIDRKLQKAPVVHCHYFLYENREEDTILRRIVEKTETIYRELGGFGTVLDRGPNQTLRRRGIERSRVTETARMFDFEAADEKERAAAAQAEVAGDDGEDTETAETGESSAKETLRERTERRRRARLSKSLESLRQVMERSKAWLAFSESQFRAALDCSLRLMEIESGLRPEPVERPRARRYFFPTESLERNPSWRETLNSLRAPRHRGEDLGVWHARCPIRPIVFEDPWEVPLGSIEREFDRQARTSRRRRPARPGSSSGSCSNPPGGRC